MNLPNTWANEIEKSPHFDSELIKMTRMNDPESSREAARRLLMSGAKVKQLSAILLTMHIYGDDYLSTSEIAAKCHLSESQVHKRTGNLATFCHDPITRKCSIKGVNVQCWKLK